MVERSVVLAGGMQDGEMQVLGTGHGGFRARKVMDSLSRLGFFTLS